MTIIGYAMAHSLRSFDCDEFLAYSRGQVERKIGAPLDDPSVTVLEPVKELHDREDGDPFLYCVHGWERVTEDVDG